MKHGSAQTQWILTAEWSEEQMCSNWWKLPNYQGSCNGGLFTRMSMFEWMCTDTNWLIWLFELNARIVGWTSVYLWFIAINICHVLVLGHSDDLWLLLSIISDSSVNIVTGYRLDDQGVGVWFWVRAGDFLFSTSSRPVLRPTQSPIQWVPWALSLGVKWLGYEADLLPPPSAEVRNDGAIPPLPHTSLWRGA
jgi:hypothetical protein